jgi:hypothetical protein
MTPALLFWSLALCVFALAVADSLEGLDILRTTRVMSRYKLQEMKILLETGSKGQPARLSEAWDRLGDIAQRSHQPLQALEYHSRARSLRPSPVPWKTELNSLAATSTDHRMLQQFDSAIVDIQRAQQLAYTYAQQDHRLVSTLVDMESVILDCAGDAALALQRFEAAARLRTGTDPPT